MSEVTPHYKAVYKEMTVFAVAEHGRKTDDEVKSKIHRTQRGSDESLGYIAPHFFRAPYGRGLLKTSSLA